MLRIPSTKFVLEYQLRKFVFVVVK